MDPSKIHIASKQGISFGTVSKIIHKDLKFRMMFKPKSHLLLRKHIAERKQIVENNYFFFVYL